MYSKSLGKRQRDATWQRLPEGIWLLILEALLQNGCSLSRLATVSREWQRRVERYDFARIRLTPSRLADFDTMTRRCRALVSCIWFCLELDRYDCSSCAPSWTLLHTEYVKLFSVIKADDRPITEAFRDLFATLSTWEPNGILKLDISIYSPSDSEHWFKCLRFMPDIPSNTLKGCEIEQEMSNHNFHDPQHGWVAGYRSSTPPREAIFKVFHPVMNDGPFDISDQVEHEWWDQLPLVPAVTSVLFRQQNRRRWKPGSLAHMLGRFPRLEEIHYEPWREWDAMQNFTDSGYQHLFESMPGLSKTLKRIVIFENFDEQYINFVKRFLYGIDMTACDTIRIPAPAVSRIVTLASLRLEHLAASFIADASDFFQVETAWEWPNLSSLVLTSKYLTPDEDLAKVDAMLQAAAAAAMKMPQLETMEIWNGRKGLAALFKYQTSRKYRQATITWRATWRLKMEQSVTEAWEAILHNWGGWRLSFVQEMLDEAVIKSHGDAIHYLMLANEVIRPVSLQQIRFEQKAMEGRRDEQQG